MGEFPKIDWRALAERWDKDGIEEPVGMWVGGHLMSLSPEDRAAALAWNRRVNELADATPDEAADEALRETFIDWRAQRRNADLVRDIPVNELFPDERSVRKDDRIVYGRVPMVSWRRNQLVCKDGFRMSVQDSPMLYSFYDDDLVCTHVEVGFPSEVEPLLMPWADDESAPTDTVYGYVPIPVVLAVIEKHGGRARWHNPDPVDWWQRFCAIQRNSFIPVDGRVRRVDDRCGRWIEQYEASKIVDGMLDEIRELRAMRDGVAG